MALDWLAPFAAVAFILGIGSRLLRLPPLVGFLAAGFVLRALGYESNPLLEQLADLGITILLFTIGLKLDLRVLLRPSVWGGTTAHMLLSMILFSGLCWGLTQTSWGLSAGLSLQACLVIGFALSFSSTVYAVKVQDEFADAGAAHARTAIGILITQDILAVGFLAFARSEPPSPWALALIPGLLVLRLGMRAVMDRSGHGELLVLLAWLVALLGYLGFELVGLDGKLGALVMGALVATHRKSSEMAKSVLSFKDLFLVAFFLTIGLRADPSWDALLMALGLVALLPVKAALFLWLLTRFRLRARTAVLAALRLATYSEFGLIVASLLIDQEWIGPQWLTILALVVAISFVAAAPFNQRALGIYARWEERLRRLESPHRLSGDEVIDLGGSDAVVFGMGRLGTTAYDRLRERYGDRVLGVDLDQEVVDHHTATGRRVVLGDASDRDFWERCDPGGTELILLAMPKLPANLNAAEQLRSSTFHGHLAAIARYDDDLQQLRKAGIDLAFHLFQEAGTGLVDTVFEQMDQRDGPSSGSPGAVGPLPDAGPQHPE